jgi:hypothetical protein
MDTPQEKSLHVPLLIIGSIVCVILLALTVFVISYEQVKRQEQALQTKAMDDAFYSKFNPTPTPPPSFSRASVAAMMSAAQDRELITRWEIPEITVSLRGQPSLEDTSCIETAVQDLNSSMNTSKLVVAASPTPASIEIYILPKTQFSSVYVDSPVDRRSFIMYNTASGTSALSDIKMLVDAEFSPQDRCANIRLNMLKSIGIFHPSDQAAPYSSSDLESVRILYSPYMTSGLTKSEVERRLIVQ